MPRDGAGDSISRYLKGVRCGRRLCNILKIPVSAVCVASGTLRLRSLLLDAFIMMIYNYFDFIKYLSR